MERKDRPLPPTSLPPVESVGGLETTQRHSLLITFQMHLWDMLRSLAGKGASYPDDPGEIMIDASRFALEAKREGLDGFATRFDNVARVCRERWLSANGSGNGKSTDHLS